MKISMIVSAICTAINVFMYAHSHNVINLVSGVICGTLFVVSVATEMGYL